MHWSTMMMMMMMMQISIYPFCGRITEIHQQRYHREDEHTENLWIRKLFSNRFYSHKYFISQLQFHAYGANPELYILPIFCQPESDPRSVRLPSFLPANQNILSQIYFGLQTRILYYKNIFCLPITFGDEYFCLQAEISFHNFVCPRTATFADLLMNIFACKIVK